MKKVVNFGFWVLGFDFWASGLEYVVSGSGFRVQGRRRLQVQVKDLVIRV